MNEKPPGKNNRFLLLRYAGLAFQLLIGIGIALYAGLWLDKKLALQTPVLVWLLPLIVIAASLYKIIKDTNAK